MKKIFKIFAICLAILIGVFGIAFGIAALAGTFNANYINLTRIYFEQNGEQTDTIYLRGILADTSVTVNFEPANATSLKLVKDEVVCVNAPGNIIDMSVFDNVIAGVPFTIKPQKDANGRNIGGSLKLNLVDERTRLTKCTIVIVVDTEIDENSLIISTDLTTDYDSQNANIVTYMARGTQNQVVNLSNTLVNGFNINTSGFVENSSGQQEDIAIKEVYFKFDSSKIDVQIGELENNKFPLLVSPINNFTGRSNISISMHRTYQIQELFNEYFVQPDANWVQTNPRRVLFEEWVNTGVGNQTALRNLYDFYYEDEDAVLDLENNDPNKYLAYKSLVDSYNAFLTEYLQFFNQTDSANEFFRNLTDNNGMISIGYNKPQTLRNSLNYVLISYQIQICVTDVEVTLMRVGNTDNENSFYVGEDVAYTIAEFMGDGIINENTGLPSYKGFNIDIGISDENDTDAQKAIKSLLGNIAVKSMVFYKDINPELLAYTVSNKNSLNNLQGFFNTEGEIENPFQNVYYSIDNTIPTIDDYKNFLDNLRLSNQFIEILKTDTGITVVPKIPNIYEDGKIKDIFVYLLFELKVESATYGSVTFYDYARVKINYNNPTKQYFSIDNLHEKIAANNPNEDFNYSNVKTLNLSATNINDTDSSFKHIYYFVEKNSVEADRVFEEGKEYLYYAIKFLKDSENQPILFKFKDLNDEAIMSPIGSSELEGYLIQSGVVEALNCKEDVNVFAVVLLTDLDGNIIDRFGNIQIDTMRTAEWDFIAEAEGENDLFYSLCVVNYPYIESQIKKISVEYILEKLYYYTISDTDASTYYYEENIEGIGTVLNFVEKEQEFLRNIRSEVESKYLGINLICQTEYDSLIFILPFESEGFNFDEKIFITNWNLFEKNKTVEDGWYIRTAKNIQEAFENAINSDFMNFTFNSQSSTYANLYALDDENLFYESSINENFNYRKSPDNNINHVLLNIKTLNKDTSSTTLLLKENGYTEMFYSESFQIENGSLGEVLIKINFIDLYSIINVASNNLDEKTKDRIVIDGIYTDTGNILDWQFISENAINNEIYETFSFDYNVCNMFYDIVEKCFEYYYKISNIMNDPNVYVEFKEKYTYLRSKDRFNSMLNILNNFNDLLECYKEAFGVSSPLPAKYNDWEVAKGNNSTDCGIVPYVIYSTDGAEYGVNLSSTDDYNVPWMQYTASSANGALTQAQFDGIINKKERIFLPLSKLVEDLIVDINIKLKACTIDILTVVDYKIPLLMFANMKESLSFAVESDLFTLAGGNLDITDYKTIVKNILKELDGGYYDNILPDGKHETGFDILSDSSSLNGIIRNYLYYYLLKIDGTEGLSDTEKRTNLIMIANNIKFNSVVNNVSEWQSIITQINENILGDYTNLNIGGYKTDISGDSEFYRLAPLKFTDNYDKIYETFRILLLNLLNNYQRDADNPTREMANQLKAVINVLNKLGGTYVEDNNNRLTNIKNKINELYDSFIYKNEDYLDEYTVSYCINISNFNYIIEENLLKLDDLGIIYKNLILNPLISHKMYYFSSLANFTDENKLSLTYIHNTENYKFNDYLNYKEALGININLPANRLTALNEYLNILVGSKIDFIFSAEDIYNILQTTIYDIFNAGIVDINYIVINNTDYSYFDNIDFSTGKINVRDDGIINFVPAFELDWESNINANYSITNGTFEYAEALGNVDENYYKLISAEFEALNDDTNANSFEGDIYVGGYVYVHTSQLNNLDNVLNFKTGVYYSLDSNQKYNINPNHIQENNYGSPEIVGVRFSLDKGNYVYNSKGDFVMSGDSAEADQSGNYYRVHVYSYLCNKNASQDFYEAVGEDAYNKNSKSDLKVIAENSDGVLLYFSDITVFSCQQNASTNKFEAVFYSLKADSRDYKLDSLKGPYGRYNLSNDSDLNPYLTYVLDKQIPIKIIFNFYPYEENNQIKYEKTISKTYTFVLHYEFNKPILTTVNYLQTKDIENEIIKVATGKKGLETLSYDYESDKTDPGTYIGDYTTDRTISYYLEESNSILGANYKIASEYDDKGTKYEIIQDRENNGNYDQIVFYDYVYTAVLGNKNTEAKICFRINSDETGYFNKTTDNLYEHSENLTGKYDMYMYNDDSSKWQIFNNQQNIEGEWVSTYETIQLNDSEMYYENNGAIYKVVENPGYGTFNFENDLYKRANTNNCQYFGNYDIYKYNISAGNFELITGYTFGVFDFDKKVEFVQNNSGDYYLYYSNFAYEFIKYDDDNPEMKENSSCRFSIYELTSENIRGEQLTHSQTGDIGYNDNIFASGVKDIKLNDYKFDTAGYFFEKAIRLFKNNGLYGILEKRNDTSDHRDSQFYQIVKMNTEQNKQQVFGNTSFDLLGGNSVEVLNYVVGKNSVQFSQDQYKYNESTRKEEINNINILNNIFFEIEGDSGFAYFKNFEKIENENGIITSFNQIESKTRVGFDCEEMRDDDGDYICDFNGNAQLKELNPQTLSIYFKSTNTHKTVTVNLYLMTGAETKVLIGYYYFYILADINFTSTISDENNQYEQSTQGGVIYKIEASMKKVFDNSGIMQDCYDYTYIIESGNENNLIEFCHENGLSSHETITVEDGLVKKHGKYIKVGELVGDLSQRIVLKIGYKLNMADTFVFPLGDSFKTNITVSPTYSISITKGGSYSNPYVSMGNEGVNLIQNGLITRKNQVDEHDTEFSGMLLTYDLDKDYVIENGTLLTNTTEIVEIMSLMNPGFGVDRQKYDVISSSTLYANTYNKDIILRVKVTARNTKINDNMQVKYVYIMFVGLDVYVSSPSTPNDKIANIMINVEDNTIDYNNPLNNNYIYTSYLSDTDDKTIKFSLLGDYSNSINYEQNPYIFYNLQTMLNICYSDKNYYNGQNSNVSQLLYIGFEINQTKTSMSITTPGLSIISGSATSSAKYLLQLPKVYKEETLVIDVYAYTVTASGTGFVEKRYALDLSFEITVLTDYKIKLNNTTTVAKGVLKSGEDSKNLWGYQLYSGESLFNSKYFTIISNSNPDYQFSENEYYQILSNMININVVGSFEDSSENVLDDSEYYLGVKNQQDEAYEDLKGGNVITSWQDLEDKFISFEYDNEPYIKEARIHLQNYDNNYSGIVLPIYIDTKNNTIPLYGNDGFELTNKFLYLKILQVKAELLTTNSTNSETDAQHLSLQLQKFLIELELKDPNSEPDTGDEYYEVNLSRGENQTSFYYVDSELTHAYYDINLEKEVGYKYYIETENDENYLYISNVLDFGKINNNQSFTDNGAADCYIDRLLNNGKVYDTNSDEWLDLTPELEDNRIFKPYIISIYANKYLISDDSIGAENNDYKINGNTIEAGDLVKVLIGTTYYHYNNTDSNITYVGNGGSGITLNSYKLYLPVYSGGIINDYDEAFVGEYKTITQESKDYIIIENDRCEFYLINDQIKFVDTALYFESNSLNSNFNKLFTNSSKDTEFTAYYYETTGFICDLAKGKLNTSMILTEGYIIEDYKYRVLNNFSLAVFGGQGKAGSTADGGFKYDLYSSINLKGIGFDMNDQINRYFNEYFGLTGDDYINDASNLQILIDFKLYSSEYSVLIQTDTKTFNDITTLELGRYLIVYSNPNTITEIKLSLRYYIINTATGRIFYNNIDFAEPICIYILPTETVEFSNKTVSMENCYAYDNTDTAYKNGTGDFLKKSEREITDEEIEYYTIEEIEYYTIYNNENIFESTQILNVGFIDKTFYGKNNIYVTYGFSTDVDTSSNCFWYYKDDNFDIWVKYKSNSLSLVTQELFSKSIFPAISNGIISINNLTYDVILPVSFKIGNATYTKFVCIKPAEVKAGIQDILSVRYENENNTEYIYVNEKECEITDNKIHYDNTDINITQVNNNYYISIHGITYKLNIEGSGNLGSISFDDGNNYIYDFNYDSSPGGSGKFNILDAKTDELVYSMTSLYNIAKNNGTPLSESGNNWKNLEYVVESTEGGGEINMEDIFKTVLPTTLNLSEVKIRYNFSIEYIQNISFNKVLNSDYYSVSLKNITYDNIKDYILLSDDEFGYSNKLTVKNTPYNLRINFKLDSISIFDNNGNILNEIEYTDKNFSILFLKAFEISSLKYGFSSDEMKFSPMSTVEYGAQSSKMKVYTLSNGASAFGYWDGSINDKTSQIVEGTQSEALDVITYQALNNYIIGFNIQDRKELLTMCENWIEIIYTQNTIFYYNSEQGKYVQFTSSTQARTTVFGVDNLPDIKNGIIRTKPLEYDVLLPVLVRIYEDKSNYSYYTFYVRVLANETEVDIDLTNNDYGYNKTGEIYEIGKDTFVGASDIINGDGRTLIDYDDDNYKVTYDLSHYLSYQYNGQYFKNICDSLPATIFNSENEGTTIKNKYVTSIKNAYAVNSAGSVINNIVSINKSELGALELEDLIESGYTFDLSDVVTNSNLCINYDAIDEDVTIYIEFDITLIYCTGYDAPTDTYTYSTIRTVADSELNQLILKITE